MRHRPGGQRGPLPAESCGGANTHAAPGGGAGRQRGSCSVSTIKRNQEQTVRRGASHPSRRRGLLPGGADS